MRFFSNLKAFAPQELHDFTHPDGQHRLALAAVTGDAKTENIIGVARYAKIPDTDTAEFAIVVLDRYQGKGIGTDLMLELCNKARTLGLQRLEGVVLTSNHPMLRLMANLGFVSESDPADPSTRRVVKLLGS